MNVVGHCRRCQSDYNPGITVCAECGGPLEERYEGEDPRFAAPPAPGRAAPTPGPPPGAYQSIYFGHDVAELHPLADRLRARGLPFRIDVTEQGSPRGAVRTRYDLAVRDQERGAALEALRGLLAPEDAPETAGNAEGFDPETGYRRCPACGTGLTPGAAECPGCGLSLGGEPELVCSACGAAAQPADDLCPDCGAPFEG